MNRHLIIATMVLLLSGCSLQEIDLSGSKSTGYGEVSYLLVDKTLDLDTYTLIFVEEIDDIELDLYKDPCVYVIGSGDHKIAFRTSASDDAPMQTLEVRTEPDRYYQVLPVRDNSEVSFRFSEIDEDKPGKLYWREVKAMIGYLFSDG